MFNSIKSSKIQEGKELKKNKIAGKSINGSANRNKKEMLNQSENDQGEDNSTYADVELAKMRNNK
jgi:hypothetical protein